MVSVVTAFTPGDVNRASLLPAKGYKPNKFNTTLREEEWFFSKTMKTILIGGAWDLLHDGHLITLKKAKELGNKLIVLVNSDARIRFRKGNDRPIIPQEVRAEILRNLRVVDQVILGKSSGVVSEDVDLLQEIQPDVWVIQREPNIPEIAVTKMLNLIEKGLVDLSARDIYSQIYLPNGGAYIRDGAKIAVNKGNCRETVLNSYQDSKPPTEAFMRLRSDATQEAVADALTYKSKKFVWLDISYPLTNEDWETIRQIIWQFGGFVSGYKRHAMYASAFFLKDGKRAFRFVNSYGEGSDRIYQEGDNKELYDITFLIDLPNPPNKITMLKVIGDNKTKKQYLKGSDGKLRWIFNETLLNELHNAGVVDKFETEWKYDLENYEVINAWAVIK